MKEVIIFIGLILSCFLLFFGNYATFAWVVIKWSSKPKVVTRKNKKVIVQEDISFKKKALSFIPVWQAAEVHKALTGKAGVIGGLSIVSLSFMVFNCIVSWFLPFNSYVLLFAHILFYIGFLISWIIYAFVTANCARLYDFNKLIILLNVICPNVFCFYIKYNIPTIMREMYKDDVFEDKQGNSNVVINQKG